MNTSGVTLGETEVEEKVSMVVSVSRLLESATIEDLVQCAMSLVLTLTVATVVLLGIDPPEWFTPIVSMVFGAHFVSVVPKGRGGPPSAP